jgi:hypothetical protein
VTLSGLVPLMGCYRYAGSLSGSIDDRSPPTFLISIKRPSPGLL